jgi:hypothetical protein
LGGPNGCLPTLYNLVGFFLLKKDLFELIMCTGIWNNLTFNSNYTIEQIEQEEKYRGFLGTFLCIGNKS